MIKWLRFTLTDQKCELKPDCLVLHPGKNVSTSSPSFSVFLMLLDTYH